ncbi:PREDICTED: uncharacterized protein LOC108373979 [Rhagoletis zephyria]|uniref:uncharacterized protein LOC108373979 n=1 Tax=Rhagoletis zephyria TaxID=28612 RepID=UPI0008113135|nr:PREDICTED: uncharacterized protein LOC108373979 [Rhagoletis zephyria]
MKFAYVFTFFALVFVVAIHAECDPDGDGKPTCTADNEGAISRNFWDPTHYWQCKGGEATSVQCPPKTGFLESAKGCVAWSEWKWTPPCPDVRP